MDEHRQDIDMPDADASTTEKEEAPAEMVIEKRLYCAFPGLTWFQSEDSFEDLLMADSSRIKWNIMPEREPSTSNFARSQASGTRF
jgi:hypothetical protein